LLANIDEFYAAAIQLRTKVIEIRIVIEEGNLVPEPGKAGCQPAHLSLCATGAEGIDDQQDS
jgi:hypothetical protein